MITSERAIEIATAYIAGRVSLSEGARCVAREDGDVYIVEWLVVPVSRGPDFDARVRVDKWTGEVLDFMVGS